MPTKEETEVKDTGITETRWARYDFSEQETISISKEMAQAASKKKQDEDNLKSAQTSIKSDIASEEAVINKCAEKIRNGYEMRPVVCKVKYDNKNRKVIYINKVTNEQFEERDMTQEEQARLV